MQGFSKSQVGASPDTSRLFGLLGKVLVLSVCTCTHTHTHMHTHASTQGMKQKLWGKPHSDGSSGAQRGGKMPVVSVVCCQLGWIKSPQTNLAKAKITPIPNSSSELMRSKLQDVLSPCPSPKSPPLPQHLQGGNLLACLFSTQVDKHIGRSLNAICCFRGKQGLQMK